MFPSSAMSTDVDFREGLEFEVLEIFGGEISTGSDLFPQKILGQIHPSAGLPVSRTVLEFSDLSGEYGLKK